MYHLLIRTDRVRSGDCLWKNDPVTHNRLDTPMSSALAADVTAILILFCQNIASLHHGLYVQYYKKHGDRASFAHEHCSCSRSCKTCASLTWRKRRRIGGKVWLQIMVSCHLCQWVPELDLHWSEEREHSDRDKMQMPMEQQTKKYHQASVELSGCFKVYKHETNVCLGGRLWMTCYCLP
jgi:hypothetical protein